MPQKYRVTTDQGVYEVTVSDDEKPSAPEPSTSTGLKMVAAGKVVPAVTRTISGVAEHVPQLETTSVSAVVSPRVVQSAEAIGRTVGKYAPLPAPRETVAEGGAALGRMLGNAAHSVTKPIAGLVERAAPYAQTLSTLGGAQTVLDLAQMAEPDRRDIGFLGFGASIPDLEVLTKAVEKGANPTQAAAQLAKGDPQKFAALLTAYSKTLNNHPPQRSNWQPNASDRRSDGSLKGSGFLGPLQRPDGRVSSELSIGVNFDGQEREIPTLVPTLSKSEVNWLLTHGDDPKQVPKAIIDKAVAHARMRLASGQSPFASEEESPKGR